MNRTIDVLRAGRARIVQAWCKGHFFADDNSGGSCALGALLRVQYVGIGKSIVEQLDEDAAVQALFAALPEDFRTDPVIGITKRMHHWIAEYNDEWCTTKEDILDLFDCAIMNEELRLFNSHISETIKETTDVISDVNDSIAAAAHAAGSHTNPVAHRHSGQGSLTHPRPSATKAEELIA